MNLVDSRAVPSRSVAPPLPPWPLAQRIGFRFVCAYFFLYIFAFPLGIIPWLSGALHAYGQLWNELASWAATHVLHLRGPLSWTDGGNGSGDTTEDYVMTFVQLAVALLVTIVWSVLARIIHARGVSPGDRGVRAGHARMDRLAVDDWRRQWCGGGLGMRVRSCWSGHSRAEKAHAWPRSESDDRRSPGERSRSAGSCGDQAGGNEGPDALPGMT